MNSNLAFCLESSEFMEEVRRKVEQCQQPCVKHAESSVMVWGLHLSQRIKSVKTDGIMNTKKPTDVVPHGNHLICNGFIFQDCSDHKHIAY